MESGFIALGLLARWPVLPSLWVVPPGTDHVCLRFDLEREPLPRKPDRNQLTAAIALNANDRGILVVEQVFDQPERLVGAAPFGGWQLDNCMQYMTELCQLRELAYHVDASDLPIYLVASSKDQAAQ
jgi:hypothetical protein